MKPLKNIYKLAIALCLLISCSSNEDGKHLFILSGQSNMVRLNPDQSFTPIVEAEFGKENTIVVKDAMGGQSIRRWYKAWRPSNGNSPKSTGDLYDRLMHMVKDSIKDEKIVSATFVWMQGERDARMKNGDVYERSLIGLHQQLCDDINIRDVNFIIGRLSDLEMSNINYEDWGLVRESQVKVANSQLNFDWINTDDLNDGINEAGKTIKNDLHLSIKGYKILGQRFAEKAINIIHSK